MTVFVPAHVAWVELTGAPRAVPSRMATSTTPAPSETALAPRLSFAIPKEAATPHKLERFARYLSEHPDQKFADEVVTMLDAGANIGFCNPHSRRATPNSVIAWEHADILYKSSAKEVIFGHAVGPLTSTPFRDFVTSSLGVRPKKIWRPSNYHGTVPTCQGLRQRFH